MVSRFHYDLFMIERYPRNFNSRIATNTVHISMKSAFLLDSDKGLDLQVLPDSTLSHNA